jgi:hypothetical protein
LHDRERLKDRAQCKEECAFRQQGRQDRRRLLRLKSLAARNRLSWLRLVSTKGLDGAGQKSNQA